MFYADPFYIQRTDYCDSYSSCYYNNKLYTTMADEESSKCNNNLIVLHAYWSLRLKSTKLSVSDHKITLRLTKKTYRLITKKTKRGSY